MTKEERYLEVKGASDSRVAAMPKRRRRAFIVRLVFAAGIVLALFLAVIGTQPRNAAKLKRTILPILSVFSDQTEQTALPAAPADSAAGAASSALQTEGQTDA